MMFRRSLRQRKPFQSVDSGECWRSSALAAGKLTVIFVIVYLSGHSDSEDSTHCRVSHDIES